MEELIRFNNPLLQYIYQQSIDLDSSETGRHVLQLSPFPDPLDSLCNSNPLNEFLNLRRFYMEFCINADGQNHLKSALASDDENEIFAAGKISKVCHGFSNIGCDDFLNKILVMLEKKDDIVNYGSRILELALPFSNRDKLRSVFESHPSRAAAEVWKSIDYDFRISPGFSNFRRFIGWRPNNINAYNELVNKASAYPFLHSWRLRELNTEDSYYWDEREVWLDIVGHPKIGIAYPYIYLKSSMAKATLPNKLWLDCDVVNYNLSDPNWRHFSPSAIVLATEEPGGLAHELDTSSYKGIVNIGRYWLLQPKGVVNK